MRAAYKTKEIFSSKPGYLELNSINILNWNKAMLFMKLPPGRKPNKCFESEVWAELIICVLEPTVSK